MGETINIFNTMNKILVTGGAGNVGSALIEKLILNIDNYIVIVDDLSTGFMSKLPKQANGHIPFPESRSSTR